MMEILYPKIIEELEKVYKIEKGEIESILTGPYGILYAAINPKNIDRFNQ